MSDSSSGTTVESSSNNDIVTCENASQIMRLAQQRASPDDFEAGLPDETHVEGSGGALFDDDGTLRDASDVKRQVEDEPRSLAEWLKQVNPERHAKWKKAVEQNMFPEMSAEELLNHSVKKEIQEAEAEGRNITPEVAEDAPHLAIHTHQDEREDIWGAVDVQETENDGKECPECGSTNTSSYQQQTGGADEGMTSFHKCGDCGKSWRGGYCG
jgi:DNA-directed RNA polymerase subunit M/transcription elongation factor TFIIS